MSQEEYASQMQVLKVPKNAPDSRPLTPAEITKVRAALGAGNWLQSQTRSDLAVQVNMARQEMEAPTVGWMEASASKTEEAPASSCSSGQLDPQDGSVHMISRPEQVRDGTNSHARCQISASSSRASSSKTRDCH